MEELEDDSRAQKAYTTTRSTIERDVTELHNNVTSCMELVSNMTSLIDKCDEQLDSVIRDLHRIKNFQPLPLAMERNLKLADKLKPSLCKISTATHRLTVKAWNEELRPPDRGTLGSDANAAFADVTERWKLPPAPTSSSTMLPRVKRVDVINVDNLEETSPSKKFYLSPTTMASFQKAKIVFPAMRPETYVLLPANIAEDGRATMVYSEVLEKRIYQQGKPNFDSDVNMVLTTDDLCEGKIALLPFKGSEEPHELFSSFMHGGPQFNYDREYWSASDFKNKNLFTIAILEDVHDSGPCAVRLPLLDGVIEAKFLAAVPQLVKDGRVLVNGTDATLENWQDSKVQDLKLGSGGRRLSEEELIRESILPLAGRAVIDGQTPSQHSSQCIKRNCLECFGGKGLSMFAKSELVLSHEGHKVSKEPISKGVAAAILSFNSDDGPCRRLKVISDEHKQASYVNMMRVWDSGPWYNSESNMVLHYESPASAQLNLSISPDGVTLASLTDQYADSGDEIDIMDDPNSEANALAAAKANLAVHAALAKHLITCPKQGVNRADFFGDEVHV